MLTIRKTIETDIPALMDVFNQARAIMRADGNFLQWPDENYPNAEAVRLDISKGNSYVVLDSSRVVGTFAFIPGTEPTYLKIFEGEWLDDTTPYATIHRIASTSDSHGVAETVFAWAWERCKNLRIDTHRDNHIMQHCISKAGFVYCGIIYLANGDERLAYQKLSNAKGKDNSF